jgi:hypothetical protein
LVSRLLGRPAAAVAPGEDALHRPAPGQDDEAGRQSPWPCPSAGRLDLDLRADALAAGLNRRILMAAVGPEPGAAGQHAEQRRHDEHAAVAVLGVGGRHQRVHHKAPRGDADVTLPALDLRNRLFVGVSGFCCGRRVGRCG